MAYGLSNGHVTDDVTWPPKVLWGSTVSYPSDSSASCINRCLLNFRDTVYDKTDKILLYSLLQMSINEAAYAVTLILTVVTRGRVIRQSSVGAY